MPTDPESLFSGVQDHVTRLRADLAELARARWELTRLEVASAGRSAKRFTVALAVAAVAGLTALPVLVVALADALDGRGGIARGGWLCAFGLLLLVAALGFGWLRWKRFQLEFAGLEQSLEELREDVAWIGAHFGSRNPRTREEPPAERP